MSDTRGGRVGRRNGKSVSSPTGSLDRTSTHAHEMANYGGLIVVRLRAMIWRRAR